MSGRLSTVVRGRFIEATDQALRNPSEALLRKVEALAAKDIAKFSRENLGHPADEKAVHHAEKEFFGDDPDKASFRGDGIPDGEGKRAIHHASLVQALRVALYKDPDAEKPHQKREKPLPIVTYWISGGQKYEIYVALSSTDQEVHVLIVTPPPGTEAKPPPTGRLENIWVVASDERIEELRKKVPDTYRLPPSFQIPGATGAHLQKVMSY